MHDELTDLLNRFLPADRDLESCWLWTGKRTHGRRGEYPSADLAYPMVRLPPQLHARYQHKSIGAYRIVWEWFYDRALTADHRLERCAKDSLCVNPTHFRTRVVGRGVLRRRGVRAGTTTAAPVRKLRNPLRPVACRNGHRYVPGSYVAKPNGARQCRYCKRLSNVRAYRKRHGLPPLTAAEEARFNALPLDVGWEPAVRRARKKSREVTDWRTAPMLVRLM